MRIIVGCEASQKITKALRARGYEAYSCDILPAYGGHPEWHFQEDIFAVLAREQFDFGIFHPPCTYLCNSGVRWLWNKDGTRNEQRWRDMEDGARFFKRLLDLPMNKALENPVMHKYAVEIIGRRQDQVVQPWMFGHMEQKATGFWLDGLPLLQPTDNVKEAMMALPRNERERIHFLPNTPDRWKIRSETFAGIAEAMADQWTNAVPLVPYKSIAMPPGAQLELFAA
ncbi:hypothetical protein [Hymenobacter koreensis]|uniref:DNA cytosine methyltransferase n=1 Tax=Hymenobacter koreensis TaxID=1084523 RepID=A0ABP8JKA0_9BACT